MRKEYTFCPLCTAKLAWITLEGWQKRACPDCGWVYYDNPLPVAMGVAKDKDNKVVLIKRGTPPGVGEWALPGGFIDTDELPDRACVREFQEETGLDGKITRLLGVYIRRSTVYGPLLLVAYEIGSLTGQPVPQENEILDVGFFDKDALPLIPFAVHTQVIKDSF